MGDYQLNDPLKLNYANPKLRRPHSPYCIASIFTAVAIVLFTLLVVVWDDPFQSMGNEKPVRIATTAGILGIILAVAGMRHADRKQFLARLGLLLNILALVAAWVFLPSL